MCCARDLPGVPFALNLEDDEGEEEEEEEEAEVKVAVTESPSSAESKGVRDSDNAGFDSQ